MIPARWPDLIPGELAHAEWQVQAPEPNSVHGAVWLELDIDRAGLVDGLVSAVAAAWFPRTFGAALTEPRDHAAFDDAAERQPHHQNLPPTG